MDHHATRWSELHLVPPGIHQHMLEGAPILDFYREGQVPLHRVILNRAGKTSIEQFV